MNITQTKLMDLMKQAYSEGNQDGQSKECRPDNAVYKILQEDGIIKSNIFAKLQIV